MCPGVIFYNEVGKMLNTSDIINMLGNCDDGVIFDGMIKTNYIINNPKYKNIMCSISGGGRL